LSGIDDNLLKVLLIRNLMSSNQPLGESASSVSSASNFLKWHQLGKEVEPALAIDGSNFPMWSAALKDLVGRVTQKADYFKTDFSTVDPPLSNGVLAIIRASVDVSLRASLNGMSAYGAYQSLHGRFAKSSWSLLISRWTDVAQAPDASDSIASGYESLKMSLLDLEERLGGWSTDKLLSLSFHASLKGFHQPLADAFDSRMAIQPEFRVDSTEVLHTASRLHQASSAPSPSALAISSQRPGNSTGSGGRGARGRGGHRGGRGGDRQASSGAVCQSGQSGTLPADSWGKKWLTPEFPCNVCWEWGHWAPDCP
jgi:hypothetical protein